MVIVSPAAGLLIWTSISLIYLLLCIIAIIKISNSKFIPTNKKFLWVLVIILLPIIGAITCFAFFKIAAQQKANGLT